MAHLSNHLLSNMHAKIFVSRTIFGPTDSEPSLPEHTSASPRVPSSPSPLLPPSGAPLRSSNIDFFQRLSTELQQNILTYAFGNLIVHLELAVEDRKWRLRGFVCARSPALAKDNGDGDAGPSKDLCLQHLAQIQSLAKPPPDFQIQEKGYKIGAMGWLLSCKQAYISGIYILYAKNTFHIADKDLSLRMPLFLPSHSLQHITMVELVLALDYVKPQEHSDFQKLLDLLPITFPYLKELQFSFKCRLLMPVWLKQQPDQGEAIEDMLMLPLDAMVRKLRSRCRASVAFIPSLWFPMVIRARKRNPDDLVVEWKPQPPASLCGHSDRFWRVVPETIEANNSNEKAQIEVEAPTEAKDNNTPASPTGYWLESGYEGELRTFTREQATQLYQRASMPTASG